MSGSGAPPRRPDAGWEGTGEPHYLLGHAGRELERLDLQGRLYHDFTRRIFVEAGIGPGDRVLDLGCGSGDVSVAVAGIVGPQGAVVGIDRGEDAVAMARAKAASLELANVEFRSTDVTDFHEPDAFDAVVGRFVLMHQADPAAFLRGAVRSVRDGGVVAMVESYMELIRHAHSEPRSMRYDRIVRFKCDVVAGAGADLLAGGRLHHTFVEAGLGPPTAHLDAPVAGGPDSLYYRYLDDSVLSLLPEAKRLGIEAEGEAALQAARELPEEMGATGGSLVVWPVVGAFARVERKR